MSSPNSDAITYPLLISKWAVSSLPVYWTNMRTFANVHRKLDFSLNQILLTFKQIYNWFCITYLYDNIHFKSLNPILSRHKTLLVKLINYNLERIMDSNMLTTYFNLKSYYFLRHFMPYPAHLSFSSEVLIILNIAVFILLLCFYSIITYVNIFKSFFFIFLTFNFIKSES